MLRAPFLRRPYIAALALVALALLAYIPAISNAYIWDDGFYLLNNHFMPRLNGPGWFWFSIDETFTHWYPMALTSLWLEYRLWGQWVLPYHVTNILLHALNAVLVWRLSKRLKLPGSWAVAAVFALHPLAVESVAWIAERKNVLAMCFGLTSILLYLRFAGVGENNSAANPTAPWKLYAMSLLTFFLALASKAACCGLPAIVLVLLWMRRRLAGKDLLPLLPFVALAAGIALLCSYVEHLKTGMVGSAFEFSLGQRLLIAGMNVPFYFGKFIFPYPLIATYPRWDLAHPPVIAYALPALIPLVLVGLYLLRGKIGRGPAAGFAIVLLAVGPALGLVTFYSMVFSFAADHYLYFALPALAALAVAPLAALLGSRAPAARRAALAAVLGVLGLLTLFQSSLYNRGSKLWQYTLDRAPESWIAQKNLANALAVEGRFSEALPHARRAAELMPDDPDVQRETATVLFYNGLKSEALAHAREALRLDGRSISSMLLISAIMHDVETRPATSSRP